MNYIALNATACSINVLERDGQVYMLQNKMQMKEKYKEVII